MIRIRDPNIKCKKCGYDEDPSKIHLHHLVPKVCGGTDKDGRVYLCKKCHDILHLIIIKWVWKFIPDQEKEVVKFFIKKRSEVFINAS